jgi:IclR family transcriptional regulator, KDG regulon repressor
MATATPYPGTQAVLRAIALLKSFTDDEPELGLSELARRVSLNKTTTYRLLTALESEAMVIRNPATDAYRLGPQAIALGGHAQRANDLLFASRPELEALAQQTGETVTLEVLAGSDVMVVSEVMGNHVLGASQEVGTRWPAHKTSTGKVMLAYLTQEQIAQMGVPAVVRGQLPMIREQGYAIADGELEEDYVAIGAPILDHRGFVVAAISAGGPATRFSASRIAAMVEKVKQSAYRISKHLGYGL